MTMAPALNTASCVDQQEPLVGRPVFSYSADSVVVFPAPAELSARHWGRKGERKELSLDQARVGILPPPSNSDQ